MLITAFNPTVEGLEKTYLANPVSAGVTSVVVKNNDRFALNDRIMIGEMGREKTEIVTVTQAPGAGTTLVIGPTTFPHEADDPVYKLRFDAVKFFRSVNGVNGDYTLLGSPQALDVDNAELTTSYDDTTGLSTYYYEVAYYHTISTLESSLSDPMQGTGYARGTVGFLVDELMREFRDQTELTTDRNEIIGWLNECSDDLITRSSRPYDFLRKRTVLGTTADNATLDFPDDFWKFDRMDFLFDDGTTNITYPVRVISEEAYRMKTQDNDASTNDTLQNVAIDTSVDKFRLYPTPETSRSGSVYLYYYKNFTELESEGDLFETPNQRIYKLYCKGQYFRFKATSDPSYMTISDRYFADYNNEIAKLQRSNRRDSGSPRSFQFRPQDYKGNRKY